MASCAKTETAFALICGDILKGVYAPGAPLRISALSRRYALSATPLREALSRLEEKRLVVAQPNRGWRVKPVSLAELEDLEAARLAVEDSLMRDAIAHGGLDWESDIVAAHHRLKHTPAPIGIADLEAREAWIAAHDTFHLALLAAGRSSWLRVFYREATEHLQRYHQALLFHPRTINPEGSKNHSGTTLELLREALSISQHTTLMEAVIRRDPEEASCLLRVHVETAVEVYRSIATRIGLDDTATPTKEEIVCFVQ